MTTAWPRMKLGEVLSKSDKWITPNPNQNYREVTVKLWGKGVILRREVSGIEISSTRRKVVQAGQLILSRIDARNGALGIVPETLDGAVVSNDFPAFTVNSEKALAPLLGWLIKTKNFSDLCSQASEGTTNRVRLQDERFLSFEVRLPSIPEQRRILARISLLMGKIAEARSFQRQMQLDLIALQTSMAHRLDLDEEWKVKHGWEPVVLNEVIHQSRDVHPVKPDKRYPNLGIYCFGRGVFPKPPIEGIATSAPSLNRVKAGQFIYSRLFAFEGAFAVVPEEFDGYYVSNEYPTFDCDTQRILPEFIFAYFKSRHAWEQLAIGSKGIGHRRQRVQPDHLLAQSVLLPPIGWQRKLREVQAKTSVAVPLLSEVAAKIDTLEASILNHAFNGKL